MVQNKVRSQNEISIRLNKLRKKLCAEKSKLMFLLVFAQTLMLLWSAYRHSPVHDEYGHYFAGLSYWHFGNTALFNVNSPLVRSIGTLPAFYSGTKVEYEPVNGKDRPEFEAGIRLFVKDPVSFQRNLTMGRYIVALFAVSTTLVLYFWGRSLAGESAGLVAASLWVFQPQIVSHGALITSDVPCAALMTVAAWQLQRLQERLSVWHSIFFGTFLSLAILAKFTGFVLVPVFLLVLAFGGDRNSKRTTVVHLSIVAFVSIFVLGIPYRFGGLGKSILDYSFLSQSFADFQGLFQQASWIPRKCFASPFSEQLLLGIDRQQLDFENGLTSYAAGMRSSRGWWWFYLYSMLVKLPVGTLLAMACTTILFVFYDRKAIFLLGLPTFVVATLLITTCIKSGFAQQHRYILPLYPFLFLIIGVLTARGLSSFSSVIRPEARFLTWMSTVGVILTMISCVAIAPHWMAAFNAIGGGNRSGFTCLFNDASDWGQDTYLIRDWINARKGNTPIYIHSTMNGDLLASIGSKPFRVLNTTTDEPPLPYWLIASKTDFAINESLGNRLCRERPSEYIGGSQLVYYFSKPDSKKE